MSAPAGATVRLTYDWTEPKPPPDAGDAIVSSGGSAYAIIAARQTRRPGRLVLTCLKLAGAHEIPANTRVERLFWYPRRRRFTSHFTERLGAPLFGGALCPVP